MDKATQQVFDNLMKQHKARVDQNLRDAGWAQDRKTGEFYNPQERFDALMNKPEILAMLKRLAVFQVRERIQELEKQAWEFVDKTWNWANANNPSQATLFKEKFAELIVRECMAIGFHTVYKVDDDSAAVAVYQNIEQHFGVEE
jgi:hypothetical protein